MKALAPRSLVGGMEAAQAADALAIQWLPDVESLPDLPTTTPEPSFEPLGYRDLARSEVAATIEQSS